MGSILTNIIVVLILLALAGTFAGLTLAFFSLRLTDLETMIRTGDRRAEKVRRLRRKGNLLLCTLLLGNVASYTAMSVFLGSITAGAVAGLIATSLIFIFAEILPQAVFPRYALSICARSSWFVWACIVIFYPVSAPIAWILDKLLGEEMPVLWSKEELGELISIHEEAGDGIIDRDEERIILGALSFSELTVADIMIPRNDVFYIDIEDELNDYLLNTIKNSGYNRIPVYDSDADKIEDILYVKHLIGIEPGIRVVDLCDRSNLLRVRSDMKLDDLLDLLISRRIHIAVIVNAEGRFLGIATFEDIMEEILRKEIEEDRRGKA